MSKDSKTMNLTNSKTALLKSQKPNKMVLTESTINLLKNQKPKPNNKDKK